MYMPVDVETKGGTPIDIITGLKIDEPPIPSVPLTRPPKKAKVNNNTSCLPEYLISLGTRPLPSLVFKACSYLFMVKPTTDMINIHTMKQVKINQSVSLQCFTPTTD
jgi:hypothetical protein